MFKKLLQKFADYLVDKVQTALKVEDLETYDFFMDFAMWYDSFCIRAFDLYLD